MAKAADLKAQLAEAQLAQARAAAQEADLRRLAAAEELKASQEGQTELLLRCKEQIATSTQWQQTGRLANVPLGCGAA